jgi:uncharacterized protein (TIGR03118 family)
MRPWSRHLYRLFSTGDATSRRSYRCRLSLERLDERNLLSGGYFQVNLDSDVPGLARVEEANFVNPWGLAFSPTGPFWLAENGTGSSVLLDGRGNNVSVSVAVQSTVPFGGTPTGVVFNGGPGFAISENGVSAPSRFLFATEDGTIAGWSAIVDSTQALVAVDNSSSGALYKGLAIATGPAGESLVYAANFAQNRIDVFDQTFKPIMRPGSFQDPNLPAGYAPFNIQNIGNLLFVTYAMQNAKHYDAVNGEGHGFIDVYDTSGGLIRRFASADWLNSPWGLAVAPQSFGPFGGALLVGNNGDGRINAFDIASGAFLGQIMDGNGKSIAIPNLWGLAFGNGHEGGASDTLFFSAGLENEQHGLFGAIQAPGRRGAETSGTGTFDPNAPGETGDYPLPPSSEPMQARALNDVRLVTADLLPMRESSLVLIPTLSIAAQTKSRTEGSAFAGQLSAVSSESFAATNLLITGVEEPSFTVDISAMPKSVEDHFVSLDALLGSDVSQTLPENPSPGLASTADQSALCGFSLRADLVDVETVSHSSELDRSISRMSASVRQTPDAAPVISVGRRETRDSARNLALLLSLLVAGGIPMIPTVCADGTSSRAYRRLRWLLEKARLLRIKRHGCGH